MNKLDFATKVRLADWLRENNDHLAGMQVADGQKLILANLNITVTEQVLRAMHKDLRMRWPFSAKPRKNKAAEMRRELDELVERVASLESRLTAHASDTGVHNV